MDIFSAANKQIDTSANVAKTQAPMKMRQVDNTKEVVKSLDQNKQDKAEIAQKLTKTVEKLNQQMDSLGTNVQFGFNDKISILFVDVVERSTGKQIRKIPTEEAMQLTEKMQEIIGTIFDQKG